MTWFVSKISILIILVAFLAVPVSGTAVQSSQATITLITGSEFVLTANDTVKQIGYSVNGQKNVSRITFPIDEDTKFRIVLLGDIPHNHSLKTSYSYLGMSGEMWMDSPSITIRAHANPITVRVHLELIDNSPTTEPPTDTPTNQPEVTPQGGGSGGKPSVPSTPDNPPVEPDTPGSDEPGSDEPYLPILPPAGSVYNLAGFIPLGAGALLLFLVFFWRRKVYRILKSHAKKHGEKPEKEHLKEIADAIIKLVRDENRYPEWRKNSDVMKRLWFDIESVLDEMNYARAVPRGVLVAEIIKAARGRINRHRL